MEQTMQQMNYSLSIRFFSDGFSLLVVDQLHAVISQKSIKTNLFSLSELEILEILSKETEFQSNYAAIRIIYESSVYSFIPTSFFNEAEQLQMLKFVHPNLNELNTIAHNHIEPWNTILIFSIYNSLYNVIQKLVPEITIEHHLTTFLTDYIPLRNDTSVHVWVRANEIDIIVVKANTLIFINTFTVDTSDDLTYYVLQVFEYLELDTEKNKLVLYNAGKRVELLTTLSKYVMFCENVV